MNILFVANRLPYPPYRGDKLKIFNLAKQLSRDHTIYLIAFIQNKNDFKFIKELKHYFEDIQVVYLPKSKSILSCVVNLFSSKPFQVNYFHSTEFENLLNEFLNKNKIDVIHTQHLRMSQYTYKMSNIRRVLDLPDAYSLYWKRRSKLNRSFLRKKFDSIEYEKVLKYENIIKNFDLTLVCSEEDKSSLKCKNQFDKFKILPNGIDLSTFYSDHHNYSIDDRIIFTGNMDYFPNIDAAIYFTKEIFPEIIKKFPKVKFYIVGQSPSKKILDLQSDKIIVRGFVKSIADEYRMSSVAVSPVRVGAGTLNKVLEPMAMGIPVVSTQVGFKGIGAKSGEGVILARNRSEFIESISHLLSDPDYRKSVGENGKDIIKENFGWDKIAKDLEKYFFQLCKQKRNKPLAALKIPEVNEY